MGNDIVKGGCSHSEQELIDSANTVVGAIIVCAVIVIVALIA